MNMVFKIHDYEKCHFHCHKTAINLFMGYSLEMPHVIETTGFDKGASLDPVLTPAFLKALNKPYV